MVRNKQLPYPKYYLDPERWVGVLTEPFTYNTDIKGASASTLFIEIDYDGALTIGEGYEWDFGSGPAIDTPDMVVASLVHDAGCDLTIEGAIPWEYRREFDREFRRVLKRYGTPLIRRWYCWLAVRYDAIVLKGGPSPSRRRQSTL